MPDWKSAAKAFAPDMPEDAVERASIPLTTLDAAFRPLLARLTIETEPAPVMMINREPAE